MMRVSSRLAGWAVAASVMMAAAACEAVATAPSEPAAGRPAGASEGLRAAIVVAVSGGATIQPSRGAPFPAGTDQELLADDTVITAGDGFVMLELHNGHIVRVRSGEGLRVDKTAVFREPAVIGELADRLTAALSPTETKDSRLQVAARVAGWDMRMSSAQTFGVQAKLPEAERLPSGEEAKGDDVGAPSHGGTSPANSPGAGAPTLDPSSTESPTTPRKAGDAKAPSKQSEKADPRGQDRVESKQSGSTRKPSPPPSPSPEPQPTPRPEDDASKADPDGASSSSTNKKSESNLDLPMRVDFIPDRGTKREVDLPGPLLAKRTALATCAGKGVQIRAQVKAGKLVKLEFPGAEKCGAGIIGKPVALADGWLELRVTP